MNYKTSSAQFFFYTFTLLQSSLHLSVVLLYTDNGIQIAPRNTVWHIDGVKPPTIDEIIRLIVPVE